MLIPQEENAIIEALTDTKSIWGVFIPQTGDKPAKWVIIEILDGKWVKKGDIVYFNRFSTSEIEIDTKKYYVVKLNEILAKQG